MSYEIRDGDILETNQSRSKATLTKCGGFWLHITAGRRTRVCIPMLDGDKLAEHPRKDVRRSFRPHGPRFRQCWLSSLLSLAMAAYRAEKGLSTAESKPSCIVVLAWKGRMQTGYIILTNPTHSKNIVPLHQRAYGELKVELYCWIWWDTK